MPPSDPGGEYAITSLYSPSEDAYVLELNRVADQRFVAAAVVPDEDPAKEPYLSFDPREPEVRLPYEVMRWFMDQVAEEVEFARGWMRLRPELVAVVGPLRLRYSGSISEEDLPGVLAAIRAAVPEEDVATVLEAAFPRSFGGS
ncbi:hypothetical protein [Kitasatospora sp. NPDC101183]|uniref:hypothetical protein n=1 Tax=Kitasatospora sp. NPDC101183 TaxID=3364100 RepID=UPI00381C9EE8